MSDAFTESVKPAASPVRRGPPPWTGWFLVRIAVLAGMAWLFEEGPRAFRWPLRILMVPVALWVLVAFVRESRETVSRLADRLRSATRWMPGNAARPRWAGVLERGLTCLVVVLVAIHLGMLMSVMARSSLREDEIGTIRLYSARGPLETVSKYNLAKNHVFFNLVNSVTPGSRSLHPLRARIWSYVAVVAALTAVVFWFFRRGEYAGGALVIGALGLNSAQLAVSLEARGYGFLLCAATVSALVLPGILRREAGLGGLVLLALATVLGAYTMPSYLVFGGVLMLVVWIAAPSRRTFLAGWFSLAALAVLYLPLLSQLATVAEEYDEKYGDLFGDIRRMQHALRFVVPPGVFAFADWTLVLAFALLLAVPAMLGLQASPRGRASGILFGLAGGYFAFCLVLKTPPDRVTAFLAAPIVIGVAFLLGATRRRMPLAGPVLGIGVPLALCAAGFAAILTFRYDPPQRWRDVALFIRDSFPPGTRVWIAGQYQDAHAAYLGPEYPVMTGEPDREAFARGDWVLHDDRYRMGDRPPVDHEFKVPGRVLVPFRVRGSETRLFFTPSRSVAERVIRDRSVVVPVPAGAYSIGIEGAGDWPAGLRVVCRGADGHERRLAARIEGRFLVARLPAGEGPWELEVSGTQPGPNPALPPRAVWTIGSPPSQSES